MSDQYEPEHRAGDPVDESDMDLQDQTGDSALPPPASLLFNNRAYELVRAATQVILPGLATLYFTIAQIFGLGYGTEVTATTAALCTFLGLLLSLSRRQYVNSDARFDGTAIVSSVDELNSQVRFKMEDTAPLAEKDAIVLRVERR